MGQEELLGGVLIIVGLVLLYCWYKKGKPDYYHTRANSNTKAAASTTPTAGTKSEGYIGSLKFGDNYQVGSLHDLENYSVNRHYGVDPSATTPNIRWKADGMVGTNELELRGGSYDDLMRRSLTVSGDILTPLNREIVESKPYSVGGNILAMTDYHPQTVVTRSM